MTMENDTIGNNFTSIKNINVQNGTFQQDVYQEIPSEILAVEHFCLLVIAVTGTAGNLMIIVVQSLNVDKSSTDILILAMAIFELLCSGFNVPVGIVRNIRSWWETVANRAICSIHMFTLYTTSSACTLLLAAVAVDRYIHTCKPHSDFCSRRKAIGTSLVIAFIGMATSSPMLAHTVVEKNTLNCVTEPGKTAVTLLIQFIWTGFFCLMFFIVLFCYVKVSLFLHKRHRRKMKIACAGPGTSNKTTLDTLLATESRHSHDRSPVLNKKISVHTLRCTHVEMHLTKSKSEDTKDLTEGNEILKSLNIPVISQTQQIIAQVTSGGTERNNELLKNSDEHLAEDKAPLSKANTIECVRARSSKLSTQEVKDASLNKEQTTLKIEEKLVNRTTVIMFLITLIYILSWLVFWLVTGLASHRTFTGSIVLHLFKYIYTVNCMTNPICFMLLSSKFRKKAKQLLRRTR